MTSIKTAPTLPSLLLGLVLAWPAAAPARADQVDEQLISVTFAGGSAMDYVNAVRRAAGELNVLVPPVASEVDMPAVTLRRVTPAAALELLDGRRQALVTGMINLRLKHMKVYLPSEQPTFQVISDTIGLPVTPAHVWSVAGLLDAGIDSDAVLSAVEMALDVVGSKTKLDVRFHKDTGLLIATGNQAQLEAIEEVINRLNDVVDERRQNPVRELESALQGAESKLNQTIAELAEAREARKQAQEELMHMQIEMQRLEMQIFEQRRMLDSKEHELRELQRPQHEP